MPIERDPERIRKALKAAQKRGRILNPREIEELYGQEKAPTTAAGVSPLERKIQRRRATPAP